MAFPQTEVNDLLARCHRRCCICHRFCGVKMELDHMDPKGEGGSDNIENAIPVCFECHAEIHSYNPKHPRGRKFRSAELRKHKAQWLKVCEEKPEVFASIPRDSDVGPLQALIDELDFNIAVTRTQGVRGRLGASFLDEQFRAAMAKGVVSVLNDDLREAIIEVYVEVEDLNQVISRAVVSDRLALQAAINRLSSERERLVSLFEAARTKLLEFLGSEDEEEG